MRLIGYNMCEIVFGEDQKMGLRIHNHTAVSPDQVAQVYDLEQCDGCIIVLKNRKPDAESASFTTDQKYGTIVKEINDALQERP